MYQRDAEFFQSLGGSELSPFTPDYRADHWAQGPLVAGQSTREGGKLIWDGANWVPNTGAASSVAPAGGGSQLVAWQSTREGGKLIWDGANWVPNTGRGAPAGGGSQLVAGQSTREGGKLIWDGASWVPNTGRGAPAGGSQLVAWQSTREGGRLIWDGANWVPNTGRGGRDRDRGRGHERGGKTVTQTVVFSDGSFRTYYSDGTYSKGYRGQPYPPGPVTQDVATMPLGPRFSLAVLGTDAFRVDNITNERHPLGQLMPDGRVLVGSILYHPRVDGTLEWVGPPTMGVNPQADANLVALQAAVAREAHEAQKTAALAAAVERAETDKLARQHRQYQGRLPGGGGGGGIGQIGSAPGMGWGVAPTPASMMPTTTALPQSIGMRPAYVIAASPQSGPSLEEIAAVTAEAAYEGAETALAEAEFYAAPQATEVVLVQEFDVFGGDPTGGGLGFGYHDPRSE